MQKEQLKRVPLLDSDLTGVVPEDCCLLFYSILFDHIYFWVVSQHQPLMCLENELKNTDISKYLATYITLLVETTYQSMGVRQMTANESEDRSLKNPTEDSENGENHVQMCDSLTRMLLEDIIYIDHQTSSTLTRSPSESKANRPHQHQDVKEPLKELYRLLMTPVKEHLNTDEIVIVPEGPLYKVPFAALQDPQTGRYFCESHRIRIAPSLTNLKILKESPSGYHCSDNALVVGNPCIGEVMFRGKKKSFSNLPAAETEAMVFGSILGVSPLIGKAATKDAVKAKLKEDAAIIHIAAHGDNNSGEIALTPGNSATSKAIPDEEDYILTMREVQEIGVRAKLVVLSCCHSGRGEIRAEGVVGMARAFLAAGARAVVASLWAINDNATLDFMSGFYTHLKMGKSASESLNESMKELIKEKTYSHPKYWAPFVLIGDDVTIF